MFFFFFFFSYRGASLFGLSWHLGYILRIPSSNSIPFTGTSAPPLPSESALSLCLPLEQPLPSLSSYSKNYPLTKFRLLLKVLCILASLLSYLNPSPSSHYFLSILASFLFFEPVKLFAIWRSLHLLFPGPGVFFCRAGSATFRAQFQWHFLTEAFPIQILLHFILFIHSTYHLPLSYPFLLSSSPTKLLDAYGQETYLFTTVSKSLA